MLVVVGGIYVGEAEERVLAESWGGRVTCSPSHTGYTWARDDLGVIEMI